MLSKLGGQFQILAIDADAADQVRLAGLTLKTIKLSATDNPALRDRYLGDAPSAVYLLRPDQHVVARWIKFNEAAVRGAIVRAISLQ